MKPPLPRTKNIFSCFIIKNDTRLQQHDLEETIFHESVHATLDDRWSRDPAWRFAQAADGAFITHYAKAHPNREDLAETALFSYVLLTTPARFSDSLVAKIRQLEPNRLAFTNGFFWMTSLFCVKSARQKAAETPLVN